MRIVIAGGSGFLGSAFADRLRTAGHSVTVLTRRPQKTHDVQWDPYGSISNWLHALEGMDAVVNLAGAAIDKRWTAKHKREMWNSRVRLTKTLVEAMKSVRRMPPTLVNASAVGIYGAHDDEPVTEATAAGTGFLAGLCAAWEKEALAAAPARVVLLRNGIVLYKDDGALPQMALPFRFFVGGPIGSGRQYLSWIHRDDWTALAHWALTSEAVSGPINATAPNPVTNREFAQTLGHVLKRPAVVPAPAFAVRLVLGEMADALLTGQRVFPEKARSLGFGFTYPRLEPALRALYG